VRNEGAMTPQEELDQALAELAKANAELAAAKADLADAKTTARKERPAAKAAAAKPKRTKRPVHKSGLQAGCYGTGERFTSDRLLRLDMTPVVTKELNPMERPNDYKYAGRECLFKYDVIENGNKDSDSWKRCKCAGCAEIRRG
jgi:hypothetical protein